MSLLIPRLVRVCCATLTVAAVVAVHAQKAKEPWEYLQEPAFKSAT